MAGGSRAIALGVTADPAPPSPRCRVCGRPLTLPLSRALGVGPVCEARGAGKRGVTLGLPLWDVVVEDSGQLRLPLPGPEARQPGVEDPDPLPW